MRHSGIWAIIAASAVLFTAGCGGGSGNTSPTSINGVWSGSITETRAVGDISALQVEFIQNGNSLTGTTVSTSNTGVPTIFPFTGSLSGNQLTFSASDGGDSLVSQSSAFTSTRITGTFAGTTSGVSHGGNFTLNKAAGVTTSNINGTWNGTSTKAGVTLALNITFTQTNNNVTFTGINGVAVSGNGAVIGNTVTLIVTTQAGSQYGTGTVSGNTITGTTRDTAGVSGTFTVTKAQ